LKIPPHKYVASDVVETEDDYLLPYLRSDSGIEIYVCVQNSSNEWEWVQIE